VAELPVYDNPAAEHTRLEREIASLLRRLGRTDAQLDRYVQLEYQTTSRWKDLSPRYKEKVKAFLEEQLAEINESQIKGAA
jgi:hypothetical protein